jgi:transposase-like protein
MKKSYAEDTKLKIIKEIINGSTYLQVSRKYGISINSAKKWFKESGYIIRGRC